MDQLYPSIHHLLLLRGSGRGGSSLSRETQTSLSPATSSSSSGGTPRRSQPRDIVSPPCPGSSPGSPPSGTCPEHLTREASRRHPNQMPEPPHLAPLDAEEQRFYSEPLPDDWASHPISKGEPRHPAEETHVARLYPRSRSFGYYPITTNEWPYPRWLPCSNTADEVRVNMEDEGR